MYKISIFSLIYFLSQTVLAYNQAQSHHNKPLQFADFSFTINNDIAGAAAFTYQKLYQPQFLKSERFILGWGARYTGNFGNNKPFVTAPAKVSEGNFFKKQNEAKLDTFFPQNHFTNSINLAIYIGFKLSKKVQLEFNIDAIGFSFGSKQQGRFMAATQSASSPLESAKVTPINLLLTGDYDFGSLNSELTVNISINEKWQIRPGLSFLFSEYTTERKLAFNNDRFRNKTLLPVLGLRYQLTK